jgi:8-amino-7-oxononanoate synthase
VSLGLPRALGSDPLIDQIETRIARLVGQERALVFPATLHAASDVLPLLAGPRGVIFIDERAYPISLAACQTAQRSGAKLHVFTHNDPRALQRLLTAFIDVATR